MFSKGVKRGYLVKRLHYCSSWLNVKMQKGNVLQILALVKNKGEMGNVSLQSQIGV